MQPRAFPFVRRTPYIYILCATGISYAIEEQMHLQQDKNEMAEVHARLVQGTAHEHDALYLEVTPCTTENYIQNECAHMSNGILAIHARRALRLTPCESTLYM